MVPPKAIAPDIWANNPGDGFRPPSVAARPPATPIMPKALPRRAVPWVERPARAPTQHRPEPRYMIFPKEKEERQRERGNKNFQCTNTGRTSLEETGFSKDNFKFRQQRDQHELFFYYFNISSYPLGMLKYIVLAIIPSLYIGFFGIWPHAQGIHRKVPKFKLCRYGI